ncbi:hypothetical protein [Nostoc sp. 'Peltigera membranacea cyanobiont' 232]|uniref:hypothetical protein n=1 Tax=Nostoc sp. 'Peltigera membranacea cyanobiont' 232 TaxID=2014531 RepID=UPI000B952571|nr:hypothetical protein [Nostoc sp. 'Peltigera membranacea cyanobiont' 232]OYE02929.1 hypothetical protein CDG79_21325 [Nostoc sp. 'Peltigera membranacea cyanobiont' 232]
MEFRKKFEMMTEKLQANRNVKIIKLAFNRQATEKELVMARNYANRELPTEVERFFREMNGFSMEWEHTIEAIKEDDDSDKGYINILPIQEIFRDWKNTTWFDTGDAEEYKGVLPMDFFIPEACAAFYQHPEQELQNTIYYHYFGEDLLNTRYTFLEYIDRLIEARGYFYWIHTLCNGFEENLTVEGFRRKMPLIFDDYNDHLFHPISAG